MPAGVSLKTYIRFGISAGISMFAGSHVVYLYYRPLQDLEAWVEKYENSIKSDDTPTIPETKISPT